MDEKYDLIRKICFWLAMLIFLTCFVPIIIGVVKVFVVLMIVALVFLLMSRIVFGFAILDSKNGKMQSDYDVTVREFYFAPIESMLYRRWVHYRDCRYQKSCVSWYRMPGFKRCSIFAEISLNKSWNKRTMESGA